MKRKKRDPFSLEEMKIPFASWFDWFVWIISCLPLLHAYSALYSLSLSLSLKHCTTHYTLFLCACDSHFLSGMSEGGVKVAKKERKRTLNRIELKQGEMFSTALSRRKKNWIKWERKGAAWMNEWAPGTDSIGKDSLYSSLSLSPTLSLSLSLFLSLTRHWMEQMNHTLGLIWWKKREKMLQLYSYLG